MKRIDLNYMEVTLTCKGRPSMFTYRSECLCLMTKVGSVALLILCETTSHSTNIYTSLSTSRCEVFYIFSYFIRRLLPPSGNDTSDPSEQATRGASLNARIIINEWMSYICFIFLRVLTVVPCLHRVQEGDANTILQACTPNCLQVFVCKITECFK
jgi:hypothetical protein